MSPYLVFSLVSSLVSSLASSLASLALGSFFRFLSYSLFSGGSLCQDRRASTPCDSQHVGELRCHVDVSVEN